MLFYVSVDQFHDKCQTAPPKVFCQPSETHHALCRQSYPYLVVCQLNALLREDRLKFARLPDTKPYLILENALIGNEFLDDQLNAGFPCILDAALLSRADTSHLEQDWVAVALNWLFEED